MGEARRGRVGRKAIAGAYSRRRAGKREADLAEPCKERGVVGREANLTVGMRKSRGVE